MRFLIAIISCVLFAHGSYAATTFYDEDVDGEILNFQTSISLGIGVNTIRGTILGDITARDPFDDIFDTFLPVLGENTFISRIEYSLDQPTPPDVFEIQINSFAIFFQDGGELRPEFTINTGTIINPRTDPVFALGLGSFLGEVVDVDYELNITVQSAVPEPATWLMMIIGFAGVGFMIRRRRMLEA